MGEITSLFNMAVSIRIIGIYSYLSIFPMDLIQPITNENNTREETLLKAECYTISAMIYMVELSLKKKIAKRQVKASLAAC